MLKSKIHRATVTDADLNYEGSLTVPRHLLEKAGMLRAEKVLVVNVNNGARFETYTQIGEDPRHFCLNGAAARLGEVGDKIIVMTFAWMSPQEAAQHDPVVVLMGPDNDVVEVHRGRPLGE